MDGQAGLQRATVRYEGEVQGVGFRYTTLRLAERYPVTGFVRNESDGSVQLVVEGEPAAIAGLLSAVRGSGLRSYIMRERTEWAPATGEFSHFTIRY